MSKLTEKLRKRCPTPVTGQSALTPLFHLANVSRLASYFHLSVNVFSVPKGNCSSCNAVFSVLKKRVRLKSRDKSIYVSRDKFIIIIINILILTLRWCHVCCRGAAVIVATAFALDAVPSRCWDLPWGQRVSRNTRRVYEELWNTSELETLNGASQWAATLDSYMLSSLSLLNSVYLCTVVLSHNRSCLRAPYKNIHIH